MPEWFIFITNHTSKKGKLDHFKDSAVNSTSAACPHVQAIESAALASPAQWRS